MRVLVSDPLAPAGLELIQKEVETDYRPGLSPEELLEIISNYQGLVVRSGTKVTSEVIEAGKNLQVIGRAGAGVDNIDVAKATEKGIIVINTPGANTVSTAEHALAMMSSLSRNIPVACRDYKKGIKKREKFMGVELYGKTLGIIGLGRIGKEVARRARAIGMKVIARDPFISEDQAEKTGVRLVNLEGLLPEADFITLHLPLVSSTRHIIGEEELRQVKPGVRVINCARGGLVDEEALHQAITEGRVSGAALDVLEVDDPSQNPLFSLDNVIVTPHLGASTREAQDNVARQVVEEVVKSLRGEPVASAVNVPGFSPEVMAQVKPYLSVMHLLGSFLMQMFDAPAEEVEIHYSGDIASKPLQPLTSSCLIGMLQVILGEQVNYVNAPRLVEERGIKVHEICSEQHRSYSNYIAVTLKSGSQRYTVAGAVLNEEDIRIMQIGDYVIDVVPSRYMLVTNHYDKPGVVGKVGTILGEENINIASMQVGRMYIGGKAVMVIQVDDVISSDILQNLQQLEVLHSCRFVELKEQDLIKSPR